MTASAQSDKITVPRAWFASVVKLLNEMAGEGVCMVGCEDPADLMHEIAEHLGVGQNDDAWNNAVVEAQRMPNEPTIKPLDIEALRATAVRRPGRLQEIEAAALTYYRRYCQAASRECCISDMQYEDVQRLRDALGEPA